MNKALGIGLAILFIALSFVSYYLLGYYYLPERNVPDDLVSWFHKHVIDYLSTGGDPAKDFQLRFIDGRNLYRSPILLDLIVSRLGVSPWDTTIIFGAVYILFVFAISYYISRNVYVSGFASILFSLTPSFIYWFKFNVFGAYVSQALWLLPVLLVSLGLKKNSLPLSILGIALYGIIWLMWPGSWIFLVIYSIYLSALIYKGIIDKDSLLIGLLLLVFTVPLNAATGFLYITVYHLFSLVLLVSNLIIGFIEYRAMKVSGEYARFAWRIIGSIIGFVIGLSAAFMLLDFISGYGVYEDYYRVYNPLYDYGIMGILSIIALIVAIRSRMLSDPRKSFVEFVLVSGFVAGLIAGYYDPTLAVFASAAIAPLASIGIISIATFLSTSSSGWYRLLYTFFAGWILIGSVLGSAIPSYALSTIPPSIYYGDFTYELLQNKSLLESPMLETLEILKNTSTDKNILVIAYWDYSYWIVGFLDGKTHTLADSRGSVRGQRLISWIMMSDEMTAYHLINMITQNRSDIEVYVLVAEAVSIEKQGTPVGGTAHLGRPVLVPSTTPGGTPQVLYQPMGDLARIPLYLAMNNQSLNNYLNYALARYYFEAPLAWKEEAKTSLVVELIVDALRTQGFSVVNDVLSPSPLTGVKAPMLFKHVKTTIIPLYTVDTGTSKLSVSYMVALYKVKTNIS